MSHAIGNPSYGASKKKNFKLKDGSNVYRILPPFAGLASEGKWATYEAIHWGYKGTKGARTFKCIEIRGKDKILKQECPECTMIAGKKKEFEEKLKLLTEGVDADGRKVPASQIPGGKLMGEKEAKEHLKFFSDFLFNHNRDSKWYLNALNRQNEIGRLAIPHKMYAALQVVISGPNGLLPKKNIDPIRVDGGVWFNLERSGTGNQTIHAVHVEKKVVNKDGEDFEVIEKAPLSEEILKRMQTEAYDLSNMYRVLTFDEIKRLVQHGGDASVVDDVFSSPETAARKAAAMGESSPADEPTPEELESAVVPSSLFQAAAQFPSGVLVTATPPAPSVDPAAAQMAALMAQIEALKAAQAQPAPSVTQAAPTRNEEPKEPSKLSNADFLAQFASGKL